jgi:glucose-6-phosphate 1-dehydrogenase
MHVEESRQSGINLPAPLRQILIIGGTGDLSRRHLLPALTRLLANGELPAEFSLVLTGLEAMPVEVCRNLLARELSVHAADLPAAARRSLVERVSYLQADVGDLDALQPLEATEPLLVYLALPPEAAPGALRALGHAGVSRAPARIVLDKPFGLDRASAQALNEQLLELTDEHNVLRIDHFLYHHMVQELVRWRVQGEVLSLADVVPVTQVDVIWDETRASQSGHPQCRGVLRDMIQSHLLQLAAVISMEQPESITRADLARNRLDALRRISIPLSEPWPTRARHMANGDANAPEMSKNGPETFVTLELRSGMPRWEHVRFVLRAAKGVGASRRYIELRFRQRSGPASHGFVRLDVLAGKLALGIADGQSPAVEFDLSTDSESASTRLLRAALRGDDTFVLDREEPEEAWRIVEPVLAGWEESDSPLPTYPLGASAVDIAGSGEGSGGA